MAATLQRAVGWAVCAFWAVVFGLWALCSAALRLTDDDCRPALQPGYPWAQCFALLCFATLLSVILCAQFWQGRRQAMPALHAQPISTCSRACGGVCAVVHTLPGARTAGHFIVVQHCSLLCPVPRAGNCLACEVHKAGACENARHWLTSTT